MERPETLHQHKHGGLRAFLEVQPQLNGFSDLSSARGMVVVQKALLVQAVENVIRQSYADDAAGTIEVRNRSGIGGTL